MDKHSDQSIMDKSMRSVFVGNIPYEATEEKLKEIFNEVGPVLSLKLVYDRESGKPKGYGFCEYKDQETALSAMRNLNGFEIGGRTLRVDNACTEKSRMEMQQLLQGPQVENPYGDQCEPENAPEAITKTVASLPPEQMYELMKQMKACIQNNPSEARQMLLQNPQLAYALLQAQVVMRIVDPQTAVTMLHAANQMPPVLMGNNMGHPGNMGGMGNNMGGMGNMGHPGHDLNMMSSGPVPMPVPAPMPVPPVNFPQQGLDVDLRSNIDPRMARNMDQDMRGGPPMDPAYPPPRNIPPPQQQQQQQRPGPAAQPFQSDPRQRNIDPRVKQQQQQHQGVPPQVGGPHNIPPPQQQQSLPNAAAAAAAPQSRLAGGIPNNASDQEKAALIMQVLQLSDEQISMLPPEQRASILVLKEQIAKSTR